MNVGISVQDDDGIHYAKTDIRRITQNAFLDIGQLWQRRFRPRHFTPYGAQLYGYAKRAASYDRQKRKRLGYVHPLVLSGKSKELSQTGRIVATSKQVAIISGIKAINFHNPRMRMRMIDEYRAVADVEIKEIEDRAQRKMTRQLKVHGKPVRKKVKS